MSKTDFFPTRPDSHPMIYAYEENNPLYRGMLKIGYTKHDVERRVAQQYPTVRPGGKPYRIVFAESAMRNDGSAFTDHNIHRYLQSRGIKRIDGEWFKCTVSDVRAAWLAVKNRTENVEQRTQAFSMRPEQEDAVTKTMAYYRSTEAEGAGRRPKFLWNAKMRFGKTFATYQLAKRMGFKRILILTFKPAVQSAWKEDLSSHIDFEGWQFIARSSDPSQGSIDVQYNRADKERPIVCFGSFQDFLGVDKGTGGIKAKNEWVHTVNWDLVAFDEYHFGAWKENAKKLFEHEDEDLYETELDDYDRANACDETFLPITTRFYLYLSGTPFRALNSGEFIEEQIYNWTYSDEQHAKENWVGDDNPYRSLPRMVLMAYQLPDSIRKIAEQGEFDEFNLNTFFKAEGTGNDARFVYEEYVQKWLDLIRGSYMDTEADNLKQGSQKPPMPYSDTKLLQLLTHTLWFLPDIASCYAMKNLLAQRQNVFYHDYKINLCAGTKAGVGLAAVAPVQESMDNPLESKTITLSCGKLTTGVTIKPWTGIFMLRNLKSPETYFQAAFRVQSPWEVDGDVIKEECYVFDFAINRALKQIADYGCRLNIDAAVSPEKKVEEFVNFLPVLAYDGNGMRQINAAEILDYAMSGTSATLLARRWESPLLVNVDNDTLTRLMGNKQAMDALMSIEGFRSLNQDIQTIINKSEKVKEAKKIKDSLTSAEKKELNEEEKEYKSLRKQIQEKLLKFATRIPVFMYLTDYREETLVHVITKLEPNLFKKVTGLSVEDFELLVSLHVFNGDLMNDAIYKFKRYEDNSLRYTGIDRHIGQDVGGWDTIMDREDYDHLFALPQSHTESAPAIEDPVVERKSASVKEIASGSVPDYAKPSIPFRQNVMVAQQDVKAAPQVTVQPTKKEIDIEVSVGSIVVHKVFGEGVVTQLDKVLKHIRVAFVKDEKTFIFPDAFKQGFLRMKG